MQFIRNFVTTADALSYQTNLYAWYKADALVLNNDDPVGTWTDSSGNGRNLTQSTADNKPLYKTNVLNSLPVVQSDGSNDYMVSASFTLNQPFSVFVVFQFVNTPSGQQYIHDGLSAYNSCLAHNNNGTGLFLYNGAQIQDSTNMDTSFIYQCSVFDGADSKMFKNGVQNDNGANINTTAKNGITLFARGDPDGYGAFKIAEYLLYSESISDANRATVETYLATKYGL